MHESHGVAYVVALDPEAAYRIVRNGLEHRDLGFFKDREISCAHRSPDFPALLNGDPWWSRSVNTADTGTRDRHEATTAHATLMLDI